MALSLTPAEYRLLIAGAQALFLGADQSHRAHKAAGNKDNAARDYATAVACKQLVEKLERDAPPGFVAGGLQRPGIIKLNSH